MPAHHEGVHRYYFHRVVREPTDDKGVAGYDVLEVGQFVRDVPGQPVVQAYCSVCGNSPDPGDH
jgi:hypothetical protein